MNFLIPPVLTTDRLILRAHEVDDLDASAAIWGNIDVCRYIVGKPCSRQDVWFRILRYRGLWTLRPYGYWAVIERNTGRFLGEIGLADWKRESLADLPDMGWVLAPAAQGVGYASEALSRVLAWADDEIKIDTICVINHGNERSIRLAERFGYRRFSAPVGREDGSARYLRLSTPSHQPGRSYRFTRYCSRGQNLPNIYIGMSF